MNPSDTSQPRVTRQTVLVLFALALAVRMVISNMFPIDGRKDPDAYLRIGHELRWYGTFSLRWERGAPLPTAFRPPLYPLLIAGCDFIDGSGVWLLSMAHVVLGAATATLVLLVGGRWGLSRRGALLAAGLVAIDPILLKQASEPMTETLATFLAAFALWALPGSACRPALRAVAMSGGAIALAALCRPVFLVWLACCGTAFFVLADGWRRRAAATLTFVCAAAVVLGPWVVRNERVFGRPIVATTHGGFTLLLANNEAFYEHLRLRGWFTAWDGAVFDADARRPRGADDELTYDRDCNRAARDCIRENPGQFIGACVYRLSRLWGICPLATTTDESIGRRALRYGIALFYASEFALAAWGAWRIGKKWRSAPWLWGLLLAASVTAVHTVYWTDMRMRAPLACVICLAAGAALAERRTAADRKTLAAQ